MTSQYTLPETFLKYKKQLETIIQNLNFSFEVFMKCNYFAFKKSGIVMCAGHGAGESPAIVGVGSLKIFPL